MIVLLHDQVLRFLCRGEEASGQEGPRLEEIDVGFDTSKRTEMMQRANGMRTAPQIFIHDRHVGGYVELAALERDNQLDAWLANSLAALPPDTLEDLADR